MALPDKSQTITIDDLKEASDQELNDLFGFSDRLKEAKEKIQKLDQLTGKARDIAQAKLSKSLGPDIYPSELGFIREDALREAKPKSGKAALDDASPSSIVD